MKRPMAWVATGLVLGAIATAALPSGAANTADRKSMSYFLHPGQSRSFNVPGSVTRVEVSVSFEGPPAQTPKSEVMFATMGYDGNTHHLSWVGTNSDGSQQAGEESSSRTVAQICGSSCGFDLAKLAIVTGPDRLTLVYSKHAGTTADFTVNLWF